MHDVSLPKDLLDRLEKRRGRLHVFDRIVPRQTALLVVDMQNIFVAQEGSLAVNHARSIVPNINRLAQELRAVDGHVIWVRTTLGPEGRKAWDMYFDNFVAKGQVDQRRAALSPGDPGHEFWRELDIKGEDLVVDKDRFSAFIEGASTLEDALRARSIDTILVAGTLTNICCESTARDAMMRDFRALMISDANAAQTDEDHLAGLSTFVQVFGDVIPTDEAIRMLREGHAP